MRLALAPKELEDDNPGDPGDGQARQGEESNEEEFEGKKHEFILIDGPEILLSSSPHFTSGWTKNSILSCVRMRYRRDAEEKWRPS
jgi:hypothetical protein